MITERELCFFLIEELLLAWDEGRDLLDEVKHLDHENQRLDRENKVYAARVTTGGPPAPCRPWRNEPVGQPDTAFSTASNVPPLRRGLR